LASKKIILLKAPSIVKMLKFDVGESAQLESPSLKFPQRDDRRRQEWGVWR